MKKDIVRMQKKIYIAALAILLLSGCGKSERINMTGSGRPINLESDADTGSSGTEGRTDENIAASASTETKITSYEVVDYPFPYGMEDWRLTLCTEDVEGEPGGRRFRMYDENGNLLQEFPCDIEAEKFVFRFDNLCDDYQLNRDLEVFPVDATESGASGLLFTWDEEGDRFVEEPIIIPWYEETEPGNPYSVSAFLVTDKNDNGVINTIYYINEKTREPVEMRTWTLSGGENEDGIAKLYMWDCLHRAVLYDGEVQGYVEGKLINDEYYQDLFWKDLPRLWNYSADESIYTTKYIVGEDDWELEDLEYASREALLADCGFQDAEPFYEYYDRFGDLELELYFDEDAGKGCGFYYWHRFNFELEEIIDCHGFIFGGLNKSEWEDDTYSLLTYDGEDVREYAGVNTLYKYNADEKLTAFEASGYMEIEYEGESGYTEQSLLSMDWTYRDDGTLYRKNYHHESRRFSTASQSQHIYYDELGRQIYRYAYITHGSLAYYYIYDGEGTKPKYCLLTDWNGASPVTEMIVYR